MKHVQKLCKISEIFSLQKLTLQQKIYCVESFPKEINSLKIFLICKWTTYVVKLLFYHQEIKKIQYTRLFTFNSKHFLSAKIGIGKYTRQACVPRKLIGTQKYKVYDVHLNLFVQHGLLHIRNKVISTLCICICITIYIHSERNSVILGSNSSRVNLLQQLRRRRQWWIAYI